MFADVDWGQVVNGGAGLISLYLATQIRMVIKNHEIRIYALENKKKPKRKKARK